VVAKVSTCVDVGDPKTNAQQFVSNGGLVGNIAFIRSSPNPSMNLNPKKTLTRGPMSRIASRTSRRQ